MAVYYDTAQQRMLGWLLQAEQLMLWIHGGSRGVDTARLVPPLYEIHERIMNRLRRQSLVEEQPRAEHQAHLEARLFRIEEARPNDQRDPTSEESHSYFDEAVLFVLFGRSWRSSWSLPSDPNDFNPNWRDRINLKRAIIDQCFTPSASAVITISAPQMLLSTSLCSLLIGFGVYFGFLWTRGLDQTGGLNDSRNIFITYITGLIVSGLVYSISQIFQDDDKRNERAIMEDYLKEYVENNPEVVRNWGVYAEIVKGVLHFHPAEAESPRETTSETEQNPQGNGSLDPTGIELEELPAVERPRTS
ncbi:hypothetical protein V502_08702 [Pseudogymnoascus sp. VKM F-4520 (FW-2644)]|nr:hypothetical protein V502_08702 [Pseudogymnoascus sp. VKM F-4520 (FW-2644)]